MDDYTKKLHEQFKDLKINLVVHDTSLTGLPCYIEAHLNKTPKDKGLLALDLGNYIYRTTDLLYRSCPEYRGRGKKTTIRWFMSWEDLEPVRMNILKAFGEEKLIKHPKYLPYEFSTLIIQDTSRGAHNRGTSNEAI